MAVRRNEKVWISGMYSVSTNASSCGILEQYAITEGGVSMGGQEPDKIKKHICVGLLAHVDAGKTTLSEGLLYLCGSIHTLGRVDHKDAFLDTHAMERARGITIFSKQAELIMGDMEVTLLDTPGHVDFSAEMERTLQVLDYAILVINGADGVQAHTRTLWKLLKQYDLPVFLFINKMDISGTDRRQLLLEIQEQLDDRCLDFSGNDMDADTAPPSAALSDAIAMCSESLMEEFLSTGRLTVSSIQKAVLERNVFPCFFGSALRLEGVTEFITGMVKYSRCPAYGEEFGARVYKISRDAQGNRLTHMKLTGGRLRVRELLQHGDTEEKINQIRVYSGNGFRTEQELEAGSICAVTGLEQSYCGEGFGIEADAGQPVLEPVLNYQLLLPEGCDVHQVWKRLQQLEEENPLLRLEWEENSRELHIQVMGEVELDILRNIIQERFDLAVSFGEGSLVYKETIAEPVEGIGHFEPLRHYAEVHLLMEPGESGSGLQFDTRCSEDLLSRNWQRLVLTHLEEQKHPGVLTGSEITDMKLTLIAGRAHPKHTEGGDFRQAAYRAVRQGLQKAKSILLEPVYEFRLEVPVENSGRALADIQRMYGTSQGPEINGTMAILTGTAPVSTMSGYQSEVNAYTRGCGTLFCSLRGYLPCHNTEEVVEQCGYDPERDVEHPTGSVFCSHGAGLLVPWYQVEDYMHVDSGLQIPERDDPSVSEGQEARKERGGRSVQVSATAVDEDELKAIFERTYGSSKRRHYGKQEAEYDGGQPPEDRTYSRRPVSSREPLLLVDGYNMIFAWEDLKTLAETSLEAARGRLMDILCNYQALRGGKLILVFDAYRVPDNPGEQKEYHNIQVVYTREAETADQYIEKLVHEAGKEYDITVATSDGLEQLIVFGAGAGRMSARNLQEEIQRTQQELREQYLRGSTTEGNYVFRQLLPEHDNSG